MKKKSSSTSTKIISITGTKGKTTVARLLESAYRELGKTTLLVDTHGYYLNKKKLGSIKESLNLYGLVPTVCPGRFLHHLEKKEDSVAILETSVGSTALPGIGYNRHDVGIFTSVFEDHIGRRIKTKESLAKEKGRIFRRVKTGGVLVFNADDPFVGPRITRARKMIERKDAKLIPVGINFSTFKLEKHIEKGGVAITVKNKKIVSISSKGETVLIDLSLAKWTFSGKYEPAVINLMLAVGCVYGEMGEFPNSIKKTFEQYCSSEENGGRLLCYRNDKKGFSLIVDYAHEKYSLMAISQLASEIKRNKSIGIIRFAPDRVDKQLRDYSQSIANIFDITIIYDKVDGLTRKPYKNKNHPYYRKVGEVSDIVFNEIRKYSQKKENVYKELTESDSLKKAFLLVEKGDIVVHIFGNDVDESIKLLKKIMKVSRCSQDEMIKEV